MDGTEGGSRYLPNYAVKQEYRFGRPEVFAGNQPQSQSHSQSLSHLMAGNTGDSIYMANYAVKQEYGSTRAEVSARNLHQSQSHLLDETMGDSRYMANYAVKQEYRSGGPEVSARNQPQSQFQPQPQSHLMAGNKGDSRYMANYAVKQEYGSTRAEVSARNLHQSQSHLLDGTMGDSRYMANYAVKQEYRLKQPEVSAQNLPQSQLIADNYVDEGDGAEEQEGETGEGDGDMNGLIQQNGDDVVDGGDDDDSGSDNRDDDYDDGGGDDYKKSDGFNPHRHPKKRKLKSLSFSFELIPRVVPPPVAPPPKSSGRNTLAEWSEQETFVLLDAWGERFLQLGRKSLRSDEWQEVAETVSQVSKTERTDAQCRNRLDTLKKKYKKMKALLEHNKTATTKWVYFKKMNMLMAVALPPPQLAEISGEMDTNQTVYLNRANGLDETRDSPGNTDLQDDDDDSDFLPPKKAKYKMDKVDGGSFKLLADSINKFSEIYEKIENGKRKQMVELEKMRMDFHKDLELQKKQILDRARDEIAKIRLGEYEENDSAENLRG